MHDKHINFMRKLLTTDISKIILVFITWKALSIVIAQLSTFFIIPQTNFLGKQFVQNNLDFRLWTWANFDGEHYLWIAKNGYRPLEYAFFPLYPFLVRVFDFFINDYILTGILISTISTLAFLIIVYELFKLDYSKEIVFKGIILFLSFPGALYLNSVYNEALFLFFVAMAFLSIRTNKYFITMIFAILASATRVVGFFLIPTLLIIWFKNSKRILYLIYILIGSSGLLFVIIFNYINTGDPFFFAHVQKYMGAQRTTEKIIFLPQVIVRYFKIFSTVDIKNLLFFTAAQEFILSMASVGFIIFYIKKIRFEYLLFSATVILFPTLTGTLNSMPRYILAAFPIFFSLAQLLKGKLSFTVVTTAFIIVQIINIALFTNAYWVS